MKSYINIMSCFYIPFEEDEKGNKINKPYSKFIIEVQRNRLKYGKGSCEERM